MDRKLWTAIQELLDEAEYAVTVLDRYEGDEWDDWGKQMVPNSAAISKDALNAAAERVARLMPEDPETPLETAIARAEYEEDR
jgi:hypothetical protein